MAKTESTSANPLSEDERGEALTSWLSAIDRESILPCINKDALEATMRSCLETNTHPRFVMTLCPVFENIPADPSKTATRRVLPFSREIPRLQQFTKEAAALVLGTINTLKLRPHFLIILNDIFEPGAETRIENFSEVSSVMGQAKSVLHAMFQELDQRNPANWPSAFQKSIRIVLQSDFVKPLESSGLPSHRAIVKELMDEALDPANDAFNVWLTFLRNTRNDPLMTPNAWAKETQAKGLHERVRFLAAMYWTDGIVDPLLFSKIFQSGGPNTVTPLPIFICGVTRTLQAEMEMSGVNLKLRNSKINRFAQVSSVREPTPAIHIFKNTAMWTENAQSPFSFGGRCSLV